MASLGTFKNTGTGITLSRRGAGVLLNVSYKELEIWAARNGVDEKKLWTKSFGRACKGLRSKLQKIMAHGGGVEGVPKFKDFEQFTKELRAATGRSTPMGGILSQKKQIVAYKRGNTQYIGWPDRLAAWADFFQAGSGGDEYFHDPKTLRYLHHLGIHNIPKQYVRNERNIIPEPFGSYVRQNLVEWARGSFYKDLAKQMAKKRFSAV